MAMFLAEGEPGWATGRVQNVLFSICVNLRNLWRKIIRGFRKFAQIKRSRCEVRQTQGLTMLNAPHALPQPSSKA
jgi:hypothetical protein